MPEKVDCVVIGAGVVGLAAARSLAMAGREVLVLEADRVIGNGTSSRNSEVIHAGLYYPQGSLKARFCRAGRDMLYAYCMERGVPFRRIGKLVVATDETETATLEVIARHAAGNGVEDLEMLGADDARRLEPAVRATAALLSPSTGIIDSHAYMLALQGDAEAHGALVAFRAPVEGGEIRDDGMLLRVGGADPVTLHARQVVNAGGLAAHKIAASVSGLPAKAIPAIRYAKGNYFALAGKAPFRRLIYPVPVKGGLGIHLTLDLAGKARFGPDVEWIDGIDYSVSGERAEQFAAAVRRYWPELPEGALQPDYAGIRTQIADMAVPDFSIENSTGVLVNLFGIESPGLTSSLAIAQYVRGLVC
ncbi:NAD(P)/FAD-dependent oxidoreductase [Oricola thermophila]|uniref:NAD(P)/FAD-dependent oxidoreductase n=1 Tax=Oricola thermophila TaxID=2742145 RepID=A0A6N1VAG3_9HYPH|nr:NAD(P)/FAD-dependent oxidoreductase [Oricola thermophila]QKV17926.1 NAD(P)/FAD-dependent oxidoreductase [Oricola thermophila]